MAKTINIELQNPGSLELSIGLLFAQQPPVPPNLIDEGDMGGTQWTKDLDPGQYTFDCAVWGAVGDVGPIVVTDGATTLNSVKGKITGPPNTFGRALIPVPFTVAA